MADLTITVPNGGLTNAMLANSAGITASKIVRHQSIDVELFGPTTSVAAVTKWLHIVRGATGTIVAFEAAQAVDTTGADRTITVDLQKSTGAGAFATVCSATANFADGSAIRTPVPATLSSTSLVDGDILQVVVTVAGAAGAAATGLMVTLTLEETYS